MSDCNEDSEEKSQFSRTLFFPSGFTKEESLNKLSNHGFKIGYSYDIIVDGEQLTRIVAYNYKKDILYCWMSKDKLPDRRQSLNRLYLIREIPSPEGLKLVRFEENYNEYVRGRIDCHNKLPQNAIAITHIDDLKYFGYNGWPIIESPKIELYKRYIKSHYQGIEAEKKLEILYLCNLYYFDRVYQEFDEGLKSIYAYLDQNYLTKFLEELFQKINYGDRYNLEIASDVIKRLNLLDTELGPIINEELNKQSLTPINRINPVMNWINNKRYTLFKQKNKWI